MGRRKSCSHPSSTLESWQGQAFHLPLSNQPATHSYTHELQRIKTEEGKTRSVSRHHLLWLWKPKSSQSSAKAVHAQTQQQHGVQWHCFCLFHLHPGVGTPSDDQSVTIACTGPPFSRVIYAAL